MFKVNNKDIRTTPCNCWLGNAVFIFWQLQNGYSTKMKNLYFEVVDLEKIFDRMPRDVWWALRELYGGL